MYFQINNWGWLMNLKVYLLQGNRDYCTFTVNHIIRRKCKINIFTSPKSVEDGVV